MKRFRLVDLPLIIKIGFAPAFALLMLALMAGGAIVVQKSQSAALKQVVEQDMRINSEIQSLSGRITKAHGTLYQILASKADPMAPAAGPRITELLAEFDKLGKETKALAAKLPASERPKVEALVKQLDECRSAIDTVSGMIDVDIGMAMSFAGSFEDTYVKMAAQLQKVVQDAEGRATTQAAKRQAEAAAAPPLLLTATAPDGVIEAAEIPGATFVLAVQWHPERLFQHYPAHHALFAALIEAAQSRAARRATVVEKK